MAFHSKAANSLQGIKDETLKFVIINPTKTTIEVETMINHSKTKSSSTNIKSSLKLFNWHRSWKLQNYAQQILVNYSIRKMKV